MNEIQIASKNLKVTKYGIEAVSAPTVDEIQSALKSIMKVDTMCQFYIGDLINIADYQWGEKYDKWEEATGYGEGYLRQMSHVSSRFSSEFREGLLGQPNKSNIISFEHFKKAAPLSDEKAMYFLEMVRDGKWSVAKLEEEIKRSKNGGTLPTKTTEPVEIPDGFAAVKEAEQMFYVPSPLPASKNDTHERRLIEIQDWEAKILIAALENNPRLTSFVERLEWAFGG